MGCIAVIENWGAVLGIREYVLYGEVHLYARILLPDPRIARRIDAYVGCDVGDAV